MSQAECGLRSCLALDTSCTFDGRDQGSDQGRIAHDDAERCHADQRCAPREGARGERHLRFSVRELTFVTSPMRRPRMPRKPRRSSATSPRSASSSPRGRETQADNRIISIRVHRTALRHPVVSTSNADSSIEEKLTVCKLNKQSTKRGMQSQDSPPQVVAPLAQQHRPDSPSQSKERR